MSKPYKPARLVFPVTAQTVQALNDVIEDVYQRLKESAADSDATPGAYGDASHVPSITIDELGRVTDLTSIAIAIAASAITSGVLAAARMPAFSGDVTTAAGAIVTTIANNAVATAKIADDAVTYAKIQNVSAASKLLGRGDASAGDPQEITLGTGLAMTGTTLSSSGAGALVLLEQHSASASATLDFTTAFSSTYDEYLIELVNIVPATNATNLLFRVSTDGGATYDATNNYKYAWSAQSTASATANGGSASDSSVLVAGTLSNTSASAGYCGSIRLFNPLSATQHKVLDSHGGFLHSDGNRYVFSWAGWYASITAVNAIRFLLSSGNIASGTIRVYGVAK